MAFKVLNNLGGSFHTHPTSCVDRNLTEQLVDVLFVSRYCSTFWGENLCTSKYIELLQHSTQVSKFSFSASH